MPRFASPGNCNAAPTPAVVDAKAYEQAENAARATAGVTLLGNSVFQALAVFDNDELRDILPLILTNGGEGRLKTLLDGFVSSSRITAEAAERIITFQKAWTVADKLIDGTIAAQKVFDAWNAAPDADKGRVFVTETTTQMFGLFVQEVGGTVGTVAAVVIAGSVTAGIGGIFGRFIGEFVGEELAEIAWENGLETATRAEVSRILNSAAPAPGAVVDWTACDMDAAGQAQVRPRTDPLILDLDGDGIELTGFRDSGVYFDIDGDGAKELTSWARPDDGFLVLDRNGNGQIDDVNELFGTEEVSGFALLAALDQNGDALISSADAAFANLRIWRDLDQDGRATSNELFRLPTAGVRSIDLNSVDVSFTIEGSVMSEKSVFTRTGGGTGLIADVWLQFHNADVAASGSGAATDLRAMGMLSDLSVAAAANSVLASLIQRFLARADTDPSQINSTAEQIMFEWAGVSNVDPASRGGNFDARRLAFIETALDTPFVTNGVAAMPTQQAAVQLSQAWAVLYSHVVGALFAQSDPGRAAGANLYLFDSNTTLGVLSGPDMVAAYAAQAPSGDLSDFVGYWHGAIHAMDASILSDITAQPYVAALDAVLTDAGLVGKSQAVRTAVHHATRFDGTIADSAAHTFSGNADVILVTAPAAAVFSGGGNDQIEVAGFNGFGVGRTLNGGAGNDTIHGGSSNDWIDGGTEADVMAGGSGNDTYVVDNAGDIVLELASGGTDTLRTAISTRLEDTLENLTLTGTSATRGTGNAANNLLIGNGAANQLHGLAGEDTLNGGAGIDSMFGGIGRDSYFVDHADDMIVETGTDLDTVTSSVSYRLGARLENLILAGTARSGTGNAENNTITGNASANVLDGGAGSDVMIGGLGNDSYLVDHFADRVIEQDGQGSDTVTASVTMTLGRGVEHLTLVGADDISGYGNELANRITGNAGDNLLDGGTGADRLAGGKGDDTYVIDNAGDQITELADGGIDLVMTTFADFTLGAEVEDLQLFVRFDDGVARNGTGNAGDNVLAGTRGANRLEGLGGDDTLLGGLGNDTLSGGDGADLLDGGAGNDVMTGGAGNDSYIVDATGDTVTEATFGGDDTVISSVSFILARGLEKLTLTGFGNLDAQGNASANRIVGNSGANNIDGGGGADRMEGGAGNDTYTVDNAGDMVLEAPGGGTDTVRSSLSHTLALSVENLALTGAGALTGTGNSLGNAIIGNSAANRIDGRGGLDVLTGGAGADRFIWRQVQDGGSVSFATDQVTDFQMAQGDRIDLSLIDAVPLTGADDAFVFVGAAQFTAAGQIRAFAQGANTIVEINTVQDNFGAELAIFLAGTHTLTDAAFVL